MPATVKRSYIRKKPATKLVAVIAKKPRRRYTRSPAITGQGAYRKRSTIPRPPRSIGYQIGSNLGGFIGHGAQQLVKYITGFGDYQVGVNSLMPGLQPPEIVNRSKDMVCLRHREYIGDVSGTAAFTVTSYPINPGLSITFPWLNGVAANFEEYIVNGMIFEFKSMSADFTTNTALGSVIMATEYNVLNANFPDKKTMENYQFANSDKLSHTFIHPIECKMALTPVHELFVRTGQIPAGSDQRMYDLGNFQIATVGNPVTSVIGELWCTYEICLTKPKAGATNLGLDEATDHWRLGTVTNANPLGTTSVLAAGSSIGTTITAGGTITFPASTVDGLYMIYWTCSGGSVAYVPPVLTPLAGAMAFLRVWGNDANLFLPAPQSGATCSTVSQIVLVQIFAGSATLIFGAAGTLPTAVTSGDLWIMQTNANVIT